MVHAVAPWPCIPRSAPPLGFRMVKQTEDHGRVELREAPHMTAHREERTVLTHRVPATEQYALPVRILMTSRKREHAPSATRNQYAPSVAGAEQNRNAVPVPAEGPAAAEAYATRHRNPAEQAASKRPATGTHRVSRDADTRRAPRARRPKPGRLPTRTERTGPRNVPPKKRAAHPGNKMPESGVQECTAPRSAPLSTATAISGSEHSTCRPDPITRTLAPRHTPTRVVTPATSTARRPRRG